MPALAPASSARRPIISVQLCTYNRRELLGSVLEALFAQDLDPADYEIILVDDGSTDGTYEDVIARVRPTCAFTCIRRKNAGLASGRNAGIARARGKYLMIMDDDVLATPGLLAAHIRCHERHPRAICQGGVINVASFGEHRPARWTWRNFSASYFWTTNVSLPLDLVHEAGGFDERFQEYGWEDLELGFRLRMMGVPSIFTKDALVYHHKPALRPDQFAGMIRQARAQARTATQFLNKHPHWRVALATGIVGPALYLSAAFRALKYPEFLGALAGKPDDTSRVPMVVRRWAAQRLARAEFYDELDQIAAREAEAEESLRSRPA